MRTGTWKIIYELEGVSTYPDDLSEATLRHVSELVVEGNTGGEIIEPEEEHFLCDL